MVRSDAVPVVFLHGIRLSGTMWGPVAGVVGQSRSVRAPLLPGHGPRAGERFTLEAAVAAAATAIDEVGGRALLVGHSMGGYVATATAARHPDRVAGLVAGGSSVRPAGGFLMAYGLVAKLAGANAALANRLSRLGLHRILPAEEAAAARAGACTCEVMPDVVTALAAFDPQAALAGYRGPVWLVNGDRDPFRAEKRSFLQVCRDGHRIRIPRRGHITVLAETPTLTRIVLDAAAAVGRG
ncbi:MAG TPA: alpha/beta hydrolase [Micromonosporaceae bacterium]|nr:alpha/beta hydrolase [Micromonosporaceae bacterium]